MLSNHSAKIENKVKFLCLVFDSKLNWKKHILYIEQKCKKRLNLMRAVAGSTWEQVSASFHIDICTDGPMSESP